MSVKPLGNNSNERIRTLEQVLPVKESENIPTEAHRRSELQSRFTTSFTLFIFSLLIAATHMSMAEVEVSDLIPGVDWGESDDYLQQLRDLEVWRLNIKRAGIWEIAALPGFDPDIARLIVHPLQNAKSPRVTISDRSAVLFILVTPSRNWFTDTDVQPVTVSYKTRASRRYGRLTGIDNADYDGSPLGLTQRLQTNYGGYQAGLMLDKDRYEPEMDDLARYYISYRDENLAVIAGDYHITALNGVTLGGNPNYNFNWDAPGSFFSSQQGVMPAVDAIQNSAFRGVAAEGWIKGWQVMAFAADTRLDAIRDDTGRVLRLSDSGLHRTAGETVKKDAAREKTFGGAVIRRWEFGSETTLNAGMACYLAEYRDPFEQPLDPKFPSPLLGDEAAGVGFGLQATSGMFLGSGEVATDGDGVVAGRLDVSQGWEMPDDNRLRGYLSLYHYPADYHNPHSGALPGNDPKNVDGSAVLLSIKRGERFIRECRVHWALERHPERTYTITRAYSSETGSATVTMKPPFQGTMEVRYRRSNGLEGFGEAPPPERSGSHRLRLTWLCDQTTWRVKMWGETGYLRLVGDPVRLSAMLGTTFSQRIAVSEPARSRWRYYITACRFVTAGDGALYLGEGELPDRLAAVRLAGRGFRLSSVVVWQFVGQEIAIQMARTIQDRGGRDSGDLEAYLTASFKFTKQSEIGDSE